MKLDTLVQVGKSLRSGDFTWYDTPERVIGPASTHRFQWYRGRLFARNGRALICHARLRAGARTRGCRNQATYIRALAGPDGRIAFEHWLCTQHFKVADREGTL